MILIYIYPFILSYALLVACIIARYARNRKKERAQTLERILIFSEELFGENGRHVFYWPSLEEAIRMAKVPTREARLEEIERRRDSVLAECNPNLPTYEAK